jgi:Rieske Fe-S protein
MSMNRREFVILTCGLAAGCAAQPPENAPVRLREVAIDAGPASDYAADGVYDRFRKSGFFVIRHGQDLKAISAICTHRACALAAEPDHSFYCKCHGSTFDPNGKVTEGPAIHDLPLLPTSIDEQGHLLIHAIGST